MNELERLIASLARPEPSAELDQRMDDLLRERPMPRRASLWLTHASWCTTAATLGLLGYLLGWQTASTREVPPENAVVSTVPDAPHAARQIEVAPLELASERLPAYLAGNTRREGILGGES